MIYMADTADVSVLKNLYDFFPLQGVTTNPTIIKNSGTKLSEAVGGILKVIGQGMIHMQVISEMADDMVKEAKAYKSYFDLGDNFYVKIPVTRQGYKAMKILSDAGINVTATAVFTQQQALIASKAGASFVAPYVSRLDNISSHGIDVVKDIVKNMTDYNLPTKVLAASFKTVDQIYRVCMCDVHCVTVGPELLEKLITHPMTDIAVKTFKEDSEGFYDIPF